MIDIPSIATNLSQNPTGIWVANCHAKVSYPDDGNQVCFAIEDNSFWFRHRNDVISCLVKQYSPNATFFDVGGGNGCVSKALQDAGIQVVLVEPGSDGAVNAMKRGVRDVIQSTLEDAGFQSDSLPSVGLFDVLEHVESDQEFLRTIYRYMQPDGQLYITVPAGRRLWSIDDNHAGHFRRYTVRSLSQRLINAGFEIEYSSYLFPFLVPAIFLMRTIPSRLGLRKSVSVSTETQEHHLRPGFTSSVVQKLLDVELNRIRRGKRVPMGSSCIAVARRPA